MFSISRAGLSARMTVEGVRFMVDRALFQKPEGIKTPLPYDFRQKVMIVCEARGIPQFAVPIIHNIKSVRE